MNFRTSSRTRVPIRGIRLCCAHRSHRLRLRPALRRILRDPRCLFLRRLITRSAQHENRAQAVSRSVVSSVATGP